MVFSLPLHGCTVVTILNFSPVVQSLKPVPLYVCSPWLFSLVQVFFSEIVFHIVNGKAIEEDKQDVWCNSLVLF